jgi:hypothetical protein
VEFTTKAYYSIAWNISYLAAAIYLVGSEKKGEVDWPCGLVEQE